MYVLPHDCTLDGSLDYIAAESLQSISPIGDSHRECDASHAVCLPPNDDHNHSSDTKISRLKSTASTGDMSALCLLLNWRENTNFASLSGTFPVSESDSLHFERDVYARIYDFSSVVEKPDPVRLK